MEGFSGTTIKDVWINNMGGWKQGREVGLAGVVGGYNRVGEGFSGTTIKDTWTKPRRGGSKGWRWGWLGL